MKIELKKIKIRDIVDGYKNSQEEGVTGFGGRLDIRPKYQREFVYNEKKRNAVIETIQKNFPLNVMYWAKNGDNFEVLDGQQRTISFCEYVNGVYSILDSNGMATYFHSLQPDQKNQILDYELYIYICDGKDSEKLAWFKTINIAGEKLTNQELRNAVYAGTWLTDAKRHFSKTNCPAYNLANHYMSGTPIRQDYLETVLKWISERDNVELEDYMSKHQKDENASALWVYFQNVINWVQVLFPKNRKEQKGIDWGIYHNKFKDKNFDPVKLEKQVSELMMDEDVTSKKGIYEYLMDGNQKHLNIRAFTPNNKREAYERQNGICIKCQEHFELNDMEADHITPWSEGGKTNAENCQMLCKNCNRVKSNK